jgi:tetratricopeptide (TPR) repeat protein
MTPQCWKRIDEIFGEALEYASEARAGFVRRACDGDDALFEQIIRLLESHERQDAFLDKPVGAGDMVREAAAGHVFREGQLVSGRFRIVHFLGEGGMGEVYSARDEELRVPVALKTLHPHLAVSHRFAERFRQEIQLARQVTHPNICRVFDAGRHAGALYFTMELLEGETLARRLERSGRTPVPDAVAIASQLCAGLSAAHRAGVLHRDFKSANVILVGARAVITDFGLARVLDSGGAPGVTSTVAVGTPAYMAPEQIEAGAVGPGADIYALGVVLFEMLAGVRPYQGASPLALAAAKLNGALPDARLLPAGVPPGLKAAILKCLARNPEDRFADPRDLAAAIGAPAAVRKFRINANRLAVLVAAALVFLSSGTAVRGLMDNRTSRASYTEALRWSQLGEDALAERAFLKAAGMLERAVALDESNLRAHARLADAYAELDMSDKAKDEVIRAATLAPDRSKLPAREAQLLDAVRFTVAREFSSAEQAYRSIAQSAPATERGRALLDLGRAAEKANHSAKAVEAYQQALDSSPRREPALLHLGKLSARQGNRALAGAQLNEAGQLFQLAGNYEGVTETRLELARMYEGSNLAESEALSRSAMDMARLTGNQQQLVRSSFELGRVKLLQGHAGESSAIAAEATGKAEQLHLENLSVQGLNDMAAVLSRKLRWKDVEQVCLRAVDLAKRSRSRAGEARALFYLGQARAEQSDNAGALRYLGQAEPFYRTGGDSVVLQDLLAVKADLLSMDGRYAEAEAAAAEMQKWGESHDDAQTLILALQRAAEPRTFKGDYRAALELYEREAELQRKSGRLAGAAYALINQGDILSKLGRYDESAVRLRDAEALTKKLGDGARGPSERLDFVRSASLLSRLRAAQAQAAARRSLNSAGGGTALRIVEAQAVLGLSFARLGQARDGQDWCAKSLRLAESGAAPAGIAFAKVAAAEAALLARDPRAAGLSSEARDYCQRYGHREWAFRALLIGWSAARGMRAGGTHLWASTFERESKELERAWGEASFSAYLHRPDIQSLLQSAQ